MKLLQVTGTRGGDTVLITVPDAFTARGGVDLQVELDRLQREGVITLPGGAVVECELVLPSELDVEYFSVFARVG